MRFFIRPPLLCFGQIALYCLYWANACVFWEGMHYFNSRAKINILGEEKISMRSSASALVVKILKFLAFEVGNCATPYTHISSIYCTILSFLAY